MSDNKRGRGRPRSKRPLSKKTVRIYTDQCYLSNAKIRAAIDAGLRILSTSETVDVFDNAPANEQGQIEKTRLLIERIQKHIAYEKENNPDELNIASWQCEAGIITSVNEMDLILSYFKNKTHNEIS